MEASDKDGHLQSLWEGKEQLTQIIKHFLMADCNSWPVVEVYIDNLLASDLKKEDKILQTIKELKNVEQRQGKEVKQIEGKDRNFVPTTTPSSTSSNILIQRQGHTAIITKKLRTNAVDVGNLDNMQEPAKYTSPSPRTT